MQYTAFAESHKLCSGLAADVALAVKAALASDPNRTVLIFDDSTGRQIDFDLRGTDAEILARLMPEPEAQVRSAGRPKLGVVSREITLLPRHWDWLSGQPGGASATLRKLIDAARADSAEADRIRLARQAADGFMGVMAGNLPGYEEASRALYSGDCLRFEAETDAWPVDIRSHARALANPGFAMAANELH